MASTSSLSILRPRLPSYSLSSSFSLLKLFSSCTPQSQPQLDPIPDELPPSESNLLDSLHSLIKSYHSYAHAFASNLPPTLTIRSLSSSLSALSPSPLPSHLPLLLLRRFPDLHHSVHFPQLLAFFNWWLSSFPHQAKTHLAHHPFVEMLGLAGKHRHFHVSWYLLDTMKELGIPIPHPAFVAIFRRYARAGLPKDAIQAFHRMGDYGLEPSASSFSLLIASLANKRFGKEAQEVFDLLKHKFPLDEVVCSALIHAWCWAEKIEVAEKVFLGAKGFELDGCKGLFAECPYLLSYFQVYH